ncbi:hypothetical protein AAFC00_003498 [Neodothiora populina]|uniref:DNA-directed RNA polymerase n=1 Tax=Neodothiora populina TaxID=2781224 RepID=A0ABR3PEF6_9PEZI
MLVRAAGRRQSRHSSLQLAHLADSLHLPFLCPAQLRWSERHSRHAAQVRSQSSKTVAPSRLPPSRLQSLSHSQARHLATAAEAYQSTSVPHYPPPNITDAKPQSWDQFSPSSDPDLPFIDLRESVAQPQEYMRSRMGIGGWPEDMLENIETNLRVERFGRCKRIIHRLVDQNVAPHYVPYVHFKFLDARLGSMPSDRHGRQLVFEDMTDWFENEVMAKNVSIDSRVLVTMIRGALDALEGVKLERAVRQYYHLAVAQGDEMVDEVINSEDYTDEQLWTLVEIMPEFAPEDLDLQELDKQQQQQQQQQQDTEGESALPGKDDADIPDTLPGMFKDLPRLVQTEQKGFGLTTLKNTLHRAEEALNPTIYADGARAPLTRRERQQIIEESASEAAVEKWKNEDQHLKALGIHSELDPHRPIGGLMWQWYSALLPVLQEELAECRKLLDRADKQEAINDDRLAYGAHLESVPLPQVAATTILYVMSLIAGGKDRNTGLFTTELKLARLSANIGKSLQNEAVLLAAQKAERKKKASKRAKPASEAKPSKRAMLEPSDLQWPLTIRVKLGAMLVSKLIETAKMPVSRTHPRSKEVVTQLQPAFLHKTVYEHGRKQGLLSACSDLIEKLDRDPVGHLIAKRLPMVIEPEPWTDFSKGGYLYYPTSVIRFGTADKVPRDYARAAINRGDLTQIFSALDVLGKIPWQINEDVLRVQVEAWNTGEAIANFAPLQPTEEAVEKPADETNADAMRTYRRLKKEQADKISGYHSQRCFQNFQLEIARAFRHEKMYFPHNIDFRGRAYPIPPYLNHMGADNVRALMKFADGKELGVEGLRWLKIHLANVFGYDKASLREREEFVMEHLSDVYDSATNPLSGGRWWLKSEDAWQTLAACCELKAALDSPDPTKFVSTLPIHQDGTCNGLQHYAALGGDAIGARQVNLEPGDRPSDVYTAVADGVRAQVERDFKEGHPVAKILHGRITRKVVKQPVMTNVYGVTYYGARLQVKRQLEELFPEIKASDPIDHLTLASYVARKIFESLGEMFRGAQAIQQWLGECADRISHCVTLEQIQEMQRAPGVDPLAAVNPKKAGKGRRSLESLARLSSSKQLFRSSVIWTTPLRLPVVQPYRTTKRRLVPTSLSKLSLQEPTTLDPVSRRKQLQGFPPNFIHSLDATHMMLSANKCYERGIAFASIHDSFWTHACDINDLSRILRDAFVDMHSEDIIGRLRHEFEARYKGAMYLASVDLRSSVGKKIMDFQKRRKASPGVKQGADQSYQVNELLIEAERHRLLVSENPEERKRGEEMVTAGSIFAAEKDAEQALAIPADITDSKLGEIPSDEAAATNFDAKVSTLVDSTPDEDADVSEMVDDAADDETSASSTSQTASKSGKKKQQVRRAYVWLPLHFPAVPEKGTFDVRRLKQSTYFFH